MKRLSTKARIFATGAVSLLAVAATLPLVVLAASPGAVSLPTGAENTVINVQNVGTASATIAVDYYNPDGTLVCSKAFDGVPAGAIRSFYQATEPCLPAGFRGVGVASSDQPIVALEERDILSSAGKKSYSIANASAAGGHKLAIPLALNELLTNQWNSRIAVVNAGSTTACIKNTYYLQPNVGGATVGSVQTIVDSPTGQPGCPGGGYAVPAGGQVTFGRAGAGFTRFPASTDNNQMAILIEVLNPGDNKIVANVDIYRSDGNRLLGSYSANVIDAASPATDDVGTDVLIPFTIKSASGHYTEIGAMVVAGGPADVTIQYVGVIEGTSTAVNKTVVLPNVANVASHSIYSSLDIPVGFIGYARITSTATVAGLLLRGKQTTYYSGVDEDIYAAAGGVPADGAGTKWSVPMVLRRFAPEPPYIGYNSEIQVMVADGSTASVTIKMVGDPANGCPNGPYEHTFSVTGSQNFYMNLESAVGPNGFPPGNAPSCFFGGATITATKPIIVLSNLTSDKTPGDNDAMFNAFKTP
ncbi:MAG: hypothetical protein HY875_12755 [Chloroflexi bacterium]|nr:hypothetical protein [Chloroflexota bacterium]